MGPGSLGDGELLLTPELAPIALRGHFPYFLKDQLADAHAGLEMDGPRSQVEDFE